MDHTTLRLAAEDDAYTVRKLLVAARSLFDDAHLLCEPALPALLGIAPAVARGELSKETPLELVMDMVFGAMLVRLARGERLSQDQARKLVDATWQGMGGA